MWVYKIKKAQKYKIRNLLKNLSFHSAKIKSSEISSKDSSDIKFLSELPLFHKKPKELTNKQLSGALPFPPTRPKRPKRLIKNQILQNILPFYDSAVISKRERAFRGYAETWSNW